MDNNKMTDDSIDIDKHDVEAKTLTVKVNRWIALPMLVLAVVSCIIDIQIGKIGWATAMFLCAAWWIFICIKEFILRKSR